MSRFICQTCEDKGWVPGPEDCPYCPGSCGEIPAWGDDPGGMCTGCKGSGKIPVDCPDCGEVSET